MTDDKAQFIAGVGGGVGAILTFLVFLGVAPALHLPATAEKLVAVLWVVCAAVGCTGLLLYFGKPDRIPKYALLAMLLVGNLTAIATIWAVPIVIIGVIWPIVAGAVVTGRVASKRLSLLYWSVPVAVFLSRILLFASLPPH